MNAKVSSYLAPGPNTYICILAFSFFRLANLCDPPSTGKFYSRFHSPSLFSSINAQTFISLIPQLRPCIWFGFWVWFPCIPSRVHNARRISSLARRSIRARLRSSKFTSARHILDILKEARSESAHRHPSVSSLSSSSSSSPPHPTPPSTSIRCSI